MTELIFTGTITNKWDDIPSIPAGYVYFLFDYCGLVYIGQTICLKNRFRSHKVYMRNIHFVAYFITSDFIEKERVLLKYFDPPIRGKYPKDEYRKTVLEEFARGMRPEHPGYDVQKWHVAP